MSANTSTAVMARRTEPRDSLDLFPTQPWATRALVEHVLIGALGVDVAAVTVWEPAAGLGHMVRPLEEYFGRVQASDIAEYGCGYPQFDFMTMGGGLMLESPPFERPDWIITNPPFKDFSKWITAATDTTRRGVALFGRLQMLETDGRFCGVWKPWQGHALCAVHVERVPLVKGRVDVNAESATAYSWLIIDKEQHFENPFAGAVSCPTVFIPPCRKAMERSGDYQ